MTGEFKPQIDKSYLPRPEKTPRKWRHRKGFQIFLAVFGVLILFSIIAQFLPSEPKVSDSKTPLTTPTTTRTPSTTTATTTSREEPRNIKASVSFTGTQFVITNHESRDWINVRFEVNPGLLSSGYTLKVRKVEAGSTYTAGAMQFANSKGERFNPFLQKPKEFHILDFGTSWPEQYELEGIAILGWD